MLPLIIDANEVKNGLVAAEGMPLWEGPPEESIAESEAMEKLAAEFAGWVEWWGSDPEACLIALRYTSGPRTSSCRWDELPTPIVELEVLPLSEALSSNSASSTILSRGVFGRDAIGFIFGLEGNNPFLPPPVNDCDIFFLAAGFLRCEVVLFTEPFLAKGFDFDPCCGLAARHVCSSWGV